MQTLFNGFGQACALMPVAVVSDELGLLDALRAGGGRPVDLLAAEQGFDLDRLQACLSLLEHFGCVERGPVATFHCTQRADELPRVASACRELLSDEVPSIVSQASDLGKLQHWLSLSRQRWHVTDPVIASGMDGLLLVSLLCALPSSKQLDQQQAWQWHADLPSATAQAIGSHLTECGWLELKEDGLIWTKTGLAMRAEILDARMLFGYAKTVIAEGVLRRLLAGENPAALIGRVDGEVWRHLDGDTLGLEGEGGRFPAGPACIVGWNGIHEADIRRVRELFMSRAKSAGRPIENPARLVLVDGSPNRLAISAAGQADVLCWVGDVTDPSAVVSQLSASAGLDPRHMLHLVDLRDSCVLDPLARAFASKAEAPHAAPPHHAQGEPFSWLYQEWLSRWSSVVSGLGLVLVQAHGGQGDGRRGLLDLPCQTHDRLWSALHTLMGHRVVSADELLMLAASEGLFASPGLLVNAPVTLPLTRLSMNRFERRDYRVRFAQAGDIPALMGLERRCWGDDLASSESVIRRRIESNPCGQIVLEVEGQVGGAMYTQRIHDEAGLVAAISERVHALHAPDGHIIQLLAVNVQPQFQNRHWGDQLLEFMLQRCAVMDGVRRVVAVTRCKDYAQHADVPVEAYIGLRNAQGRLVDSVLRFHELHGARIRGLVRHYRPKDHVNQGHGVLVEYDIRLRRRDDLSIPSASARTASLSAHELAQMVVVAVRAVLKGAHEFSPSCPLMEMGLDSADLMQLAEDISCRLGCALPATFFFEFNTCEKVTSALAERLVLAEASAPPPPGAGITAVPVQEMVQAEVASPSDARDIAIVGLACSLPGGITDLVTLWDVLSQGREVVGSMPATRWRWPEGIDPFEAHRGIDRGSFIEDISLFDAGFFRVSPREAEMMDPQQRLLLELTWSCIEDAGYSAKALAGTATGVYVGASGSDYQHVLGQRREVEAHHGLSTSMAVLANRLSYFFDWNGPSLQIDTACSSSLVALHEAIRAMRDGTCQQALVAGINLMIHPATTIAFYKAGMLSKDGRCKTFDASADGYVRAEGAVVLMLKPLEHAKRDGDHIHGVVKGSAVNHGGEAGGLTVPHPARQADLLVAAYKDAGIGPGRVGYIEAHGTGTSLGDPIEVRGLKDAFKRMSIGATGSQTVGIGSIKTNVGHLEAAAGLGGVLKVLASMRHHVLPASLNFHQLNPQIDLEGTGLYVVDKAQPWHSDGATLRCAGVSSFGSGGTNAHVVLEEAPRETRTLADAPSGQLLIPLSAKSDAQLRQTAENLLAHLRRHELDLRSVAYTLQVGRVAMPSRVAFVVRDDVELIEQLEAFCAGRALTSGFARAMPSSGGEPSGSVGEADEDVLALWLQWWRKGKLHRLAKAWAHGADLAWEAFQAGDRPARVSLPTCVFARKRHWAEPAVAPLSAPSAVAPAAWLHPLLHRNTSDVAGLKFTSRFEGTEFFLADHVVQGERVLPAAAQLEMVLTAVRLSIGDQWAEGVSVSLHDVAFVRPVTLNGGALDLHLAFDPDDEESLSFEVFSHDDERGQRVVHSQGRASWCTVSPSVDEVLDLKVLRLQSTTSIDVNGCYQDLDRIGLAYGAGFRALSELRIVHQPSGLDSALADVEVPTSVLSLSPEAYHLHPSVVDAALQASLALILHAGGTDSSTLLPFSIESVEVLRATPARGVALVKPRPGGQHQGPVRTLDIDITDETGQVCLRLRGLSVRVLGSAPGSNVVTLLMAPQWQTVADMGSPADVVRQGRHLIILCECGESSPAVLDQLAGHGLGQAELIQFNRAGQECLAQAYTRYACDLLALVQGALGGKGPGPTLVQLVVPDQVEKRPLAGLHGLLKSASQESPNVIGQLLWAEGEQGPLAWAALASVTRSRSRSGEWRVREGAVQTSRLQELGQVPEPSRPWCRDEAVYLITGGAGGLGAKFARNMAQQAKGVGLILAGRSPLGPKQQSLLDELRALGARAFYESVDITEPSQVCGLIDRLLAREGAIHGVLHCAGVLKDSFLVKKTSEELKAVFAPKVRALVTLDEATRSLPLECFVVFGSTSGVLGNVGQSDYAAANAFVDGYAVYRQAQVDGGMASGQTLAIDWPLWADGGMQVDHLTRRRLWDQTGQSALSSDAGVLALGQALASGQTQVVVMQGDGPRLREAWLSDPAAAPELPDAPHVATALEAGGGAVDPALHDKVVRELRALLVSTLKLPPDQVDGQVSFDRFGLDSMLALELVSALEKPLGHLPKTLFFEHHSLNALADFLVKERAAAVLAWVGASVKRSPATVPVVSLANLSAAWTSTQGVRQRFLAATPARKPDAPGPCDIAIIGLSGRYPKARSLAEYWANLCQGLDCVSEIPVERWDHRDYFEESRGHPGKSYSKWGAFIDGVDEFDPLFFNISPREAKVMDPQERLFLQCAHAVMEDAGYTREALCAKHQGNGLPGNVGVFVGVMWNEYQLYGAQMGKGYALQGHVSSIANRVSYVCNFHGPSMAVDTMCSSSLTAIHLACQSIASGACEVAIAGGVNVSIHPNKYLALAQGMFVASDGLCKSFGEGGDGYVPGEGVGAVLLKPLSKALADGDQIHGVIKASAINHGGKTSGYTVPNPSAQAQVISMALKESGVNARAVSYIEAHGTGTALGDPIEIAGLSKAFSADTSDKGYCAIGSAKSNIGHCESAAGIAGLAKVLLQMKHQMLVPSLHSRKLNEHIDFERTPFVVQHELAPWNRPQVPQGDRTIEGARIAGLSSFGAGGANAHLIIEEHPEYRAPGAVVVTEDRPAVVVLSGKDAERLKEQAAQLLRVLETGEIQDCDLGDVAYTLQVGREVHGHRLACVAGTLKGLQDQLTAYLVGRAQIDSLYQAEVKGHQEALSTVLGVDDLARLSRSWVDEGQVHKLAKAWVRGLNVEWKELYGEARPRRISLPTYPFAKERYWVDTAAAPTRRGHGVGEVLHPLVHRNTSDVQGLRYTTALSGNEFFLADHVVQGRKVLPGVAHLEMARHAASLVLGRGLHVDSHSPMVELRDVVFARPLVVGEHGAQVHIALLPQADIAREVAFEIHSEQAGQFVLHSQGRAVLVEQPVPVQDLNLGQLQAQCRGMPMDASRSYVAFERLGLSYGERMRSLQTLNRGVDEQGRSIVLGQLQLGGWARAMTGEYVLHPSVMDAALQATLGLHAGEDGVTMLPFAVERVQVFKAVPTRAWSWIRHAPASQAGQAVQKLDIDVLDELGKVCVSLQGYSARVLQDQAPGTTQTLLLQPEWVPQVAQPGALQGTSAVHERHVVIMIPGAGEAGQAASQAQAHLPQANWVVLPLQEGTPAERYEAHAQQLLAQLQVVLASKPSSTVLVQVVHSAQDSGLRGLAGLLKSVGQESAKLAWQIVEHDGLQTGAALAQLLQEQAQVAHIAREVRCQPDGTVQVRQLQEVAKADVAVHALGKPGGVYLITGGLGGLGRIFAREIAQAHGDVVLVLTGRSPLPMADERVQALRSLGARVEYWAVDVSQVAQVKGLVQGLVHRHGKLDGVIHSAGVLKDSFALKKTAQELSEVFAPKVKGLSALGEATQGLVLDYFVAFSSVSGEFGNLGQADYAAANAYMDEYMQERARQVSQGHGTGHSLSVNWPLWAQGGMQVDEGTLQRMRDHEGIEPLSTEDGVKALGQALTLGLAQVVVMSGHADRIRQSVLNPRPSLVQAHAKVRVESQAAGQAPTGDEAVSLKHKVERYLKGMLASGLNLAAGRIDSAAALEQYGIDSVLALELVGVLEQKFGKLSKTLFFEYQSIDALAAYFVQEHAATLGEILGLDEAKAPTMVAPAMVPPTARGQASPARPVVEPVKPSVKPMATDALDIAIIGMSGRFPKARTLQQYWRNLTQGVDCITEVPEQRWDASRHFDPQKGKLGKSYSKWGGFIDGVDEFDPDFFNILPREALAMDPQERLFLQCVHETLEDAGYPRQTLARSDQDRVGVYVGSMYLQYRTDGIDTEPGAANLDALHSGLANRVSQYFGFGGPSMAIDTMCSSSTIAIYQACKDLIQGDCELAIAGGVNLSVHPRKFIGLSEIEILASHEGSRSFSDGDGYLPAEAVGAVLLKPLSKAVADGDRILAVVKGGATNHGGRSGGYFVPNPQAQARVMAQSLQRAGIGADTVSYVEAAANGSLLGDAIEFAALRKVFATDGMGQACGIGSVKSSIGHPEAASGMAQLAKVVLQMNHGQIAPTIRVDKLNPDIRFEDSSLVLRRELIDWVRPSHRIGGQVHEIPRRALINSFGAGGSNASLVIEEYVSALPSQPRVPETGPQVFVFSASTAERLTVVVEQMLAHVEANNAMRLDDLAFSLQVCKEALPFRLALVVDSRLELVNALRRASTALPGASDVDGGPALHRGDLSQGLTEMQQMLSGQAGETFVNALLEQRDMERLAMHWAQGGAVDWPRVHAGNGVKKVPLPAYPFARQKYWMLPLDANEMAVRKTPVITGQTSAAKPPAERVGGLYQRCCDHTVMVLASALNIARHQIDVRRPMRDHGVDSVVALRLMRELSSEFGIELSGRDLLTHDTVDALARHVVERSGPPSHLSDGMARDMIVLHSLEQFESGLLRIEQIQDILDKAGINEAA